jgi:hypothetical protein
MLTLYNGSRHGYYTDHDSLDASNPPTSSQLETQQDNGDEQGDDKVNIAFAFATSSLPISNLHKDEWKRHFLFGEATTVGHGCSGLVFAIDEERVIKMFTDDEEGRMDLERERIVYDKLKSVLQCCSGKRICLEGRSNSYRTTLAQATLETYLPRYIFLGH